MTDAELIASFLANKGATAVPTGQRVMTDKQMKRACGYRPEKELKFEALLTGEDGEEFMVTVTAPSLAEAVAEVEDQYPESVAQSVEPYGSRAARIYQSVW